MSNKNGITWEHLKNLMKRDCFKMGGISRTIYEYINGDFTLTKKQLDYLIDKDIKYNKSINKRR